jgi:hypothetical protein
VKKISGILFVVLILGSSVRTIAQVTEQEKKLRTISGDTVFGWKKGALLSLNFVQSSFNNWSAGGKNSVAFNGLVSLYAKHNTANSAFENYLDLGYGLLKEGKADLQKTDDRIELLSKYGQRARKNWYYSGLVNFRSQFAGGYNYPNDSVKISDFLAPAYVLAALGFDFKPNSYFSLFIAPVTTKYTIVNNSHLSDLGSFGVEPGKKTRSEWGGYLRLVYSRKDFQAEILKNVAFTTKLDMFSNYANHPQNIDINWETLIVMKVNKFLSVNLNTQLIYDDDIDIVKDGVVLGPRTQFKEILGVGLSFKM